MKIKDMLIDQVTSIRDMTLATFNDLAPDERLFQPAPGLNHAVWLLGHIATSQDHLILDFCTGKPLLPARYNELFAMGSRLLEDSSGYPRTDEMLERLAAGYEATLAYLRGADEAEFDREPTCFGRFDDRARGMFATRGRCVWFHAHHEAMHAGQMGYLRRLTGKPFRV
ncbi:MAG: DinB family protein [Planctomycetes bacterium]|nr:DinB family protein [Planctomycetota bacterium]